MKTRKDLYDFLEKSDEGKELVAVVKAEVDTITKLEGEKKTIKAELTTATEKLDKSKDILEYVETENITLDTIKGQVKKVEESMTDLQKIQKRLDESDAKVQKLTDDNKAKDEKAAALQKEKNETKLIDAFIKEMPGVNPKPLKSDVKLAIAAGDIRFSEEGKIEAKVEGVFGTLEDFSESYKNANPEYLISEEGPDAGLPPKKGDQKPNNDDDKKTGFDHFEEKYKTQ